jgi:hypothetical protein
VLHVIYRKVSTTSDNRWDRRYDINGAWSFVRRRNISYIGNISGICGASYIEWWFFGRS